ncbi:MAG TPA: PQQ-binding-like beta-propeller repeat protein [Bryobacteraceae bacterium]|nr:PQQ-binding-like beta-propeller repeat protein [Bryobacteraceae bacterium]
MRATLVLRLPISLLLLAAVGRPEEWSRFRGPNGQGVSEATDYPVAFGNGQNLLWRTPVRSGKSSPILSDKHVFLTGFENQTLYTQCFDRFTGKLLWERAEPVSHKGSVNQLNHPAAISPVTDGDNVYVFFPDYGLLSYSAAGKRRWRVPLGPFTNSQGLGAAPILAGKLLILQIDQLEGSYIAAYSAANGKLRWKTAREESESWGTPILHEGPGKEMQIITVGANQIGGHRAADGKRTFTFPQASPSMVAGPVIDGHTLYAFGYGFQTSMPFSRLLERSDKNKDGVITPDEYGGVNVLRAAGNYMGNRDGVVNEEKWKLWNDHVKGPTGLVALDLTAANLTVNPVLLWRFERGFESVIPSPLLYEGILYSVKNGGILTAIDAKTGTVTKTGRIQGALGGYSASPVLGGGRLYFVSEEGKAAVVRPGRDWDVERVNDLHEEMFATPALSAGRIYLRTGAALYCFGKQ